MNFDYQQAGVDEYTVTTNGLDIGTISFDPHTHQWHAPAADPLPNREAAARALLAHYRST